MRRKKCFFFSIILSLCTFCCCDRYYIPKMPEGQLRMPKNRVWAHKVNDLSVLKTKQRRFCGIELDLVYSFYQNKLFVCHDEEDTTKNLTLEKWFEAINHPQKHCYWIDVKNLNYFTADSISCMVKRILEQYNIVDQAFLESSNENGIIKARMHNLHTSLWVDNINWSHVDTATWINKTSRQIEEMHPDCISCEYRMFEALTKYFPDENILLWHTPAELTPENADLTCKFCRHPSVKIVLVDYDKPVKY